MPKTSSSAADTLKVGNRVVAIGIGAIVGILAITAIFLFRALPDADEFNERVRTLFLESGSLSSDAEIKLLEILAESGTTFAAILSSYRVVIFVLLIFSTALLVATLVFLVMLLILNKRVQEIDKMGIQVSSLVISRGERLVFLNDMEFKLTEAAIETLAVLAEARMDGDVLSGAELEAMIQGRNAADCEESAGATRIKRLRDSLGNQMVSELLVKNISRKGYMLAIDKDVIRMT